MFFLHETYKMSVKWRGSSWILLKASVKEGAVELNVRVSNPVDLVYLLG
jgi:hypothetical protein